MDNTLRAIHNLIKAAIIEAAEERPDLFGLTTIIQETKRDVFLNSSEAAKFLKLSNKKLYQMTAAGVIQSYRIGRKHLFDKKELIKSLKNHSDK